MPSPGNQNASTEFLRNFTFHRLTDSVVRELFGQAAQPSWMKFTISQARNVARFSHVFRLHVDVQPNAKLDFSGNGPIRVGPAVRPRKFVVEFEVPDNVIREFRSDFARMFATWLKKAVMENAHKFYELDPRIGWRPTEDEPQLPESRLFDPPGRFSRNGLSFIEIDKETATSKRIESRCPFCREIHEGDDRPMWGGGNLMWVHRHCWRGS